MPGGGTVRIETRNVVLDEGEAAALPEGAPGDYVLVQVSDTGTGMDARHGGPRLRALLHHQGAGEGTGLGLSTVTASCARAGASCGCGARPAWDRRRRLPAAHEGADQADAPPRGGPPRPAARGGTVLVAEDEEQVRRLLESRLGRRGSRCWRRRTGGRRLEVAGRHAGRIDVLLSDVVMPRLSGPDLARGLRAIHPETVVVFLTGHAGRRWNAREDARSGGFFEKPATSTTSPPRCAVSSPRGARREGASGPIPRVRITCVAPRPG